MPPALSNTNIHGIQHQRALKLPKEGIQLIPQDFLTLFTISKGDLCAFCMELGELQEGFYENSV